ncbi:MAG TPA: tRNA 2-thiouridine(34) synthase MnmA [Bacillota bacterium]|nr:tRNA 2-thiouridine(34) synthase MnmA [Bacillota bacterium]
MNTPKEKVILGFSGGVDSACCAIMLKEKGYDVIGLYIEVLEPSDKSALSAAQKAAEAIGMELVVRGAAEDFEELVIKPFCDSYASGETPNPCVRCNPALKFAILAEEADRRNAQYIASGHYARLEFYNKYYYVKRAKCLEKDQSYMLCRLTQTQLSRLLLPMGDMFSKQEARELLRSRGIPNSEAKDSQDICFLPDGDYRSFLVGRGITAAKGNFISPEGEIYGPHEGSFCYTVGQRKGLGIALGNPVFVSEIRQNGDVVLSPEEKLLKKHVEIRDVMYTGLDAVKGGQFTAKLRYTKQEAECFLEPIGQAEALLMFKTPQRAPAPGQEAVVYDGERIVACGKIAGSY